MDYDDRHVPADPTRILVVEDDAALRPLVAMHLADHGFSVVEAATADEAVTTLQKDGGIALVFSDIQTPGTFDGVDLARWISREMPSLKVLLTSGAALPARGRAWPFVAKPYNLDKVGRQLHDLAND